MVIRFGVAGFSACLGGGGGGGATLGTEPMMPPSTPPGVPPATPPGMPPATPLEAATGGSSSSLICAISFGTVFGAITLPASNWRGITLTIFTGAGCAGGGGGGGGGGGATKRLVNLVA